MNEIQEMLARLAELTSEELETLAGLLSAEADRLLDLDPTDENLAALADTATGLNAVAERQAAIAADAADRQARQQALRDQIAQVTGGEPAADDAAADADATADADAAPAADADAAADGERTPVAASGAQRTPQIRATARVPQAMQARQTLPELNRAALVAAGDFDTVRAGAVLADPETAARAFISAIQTSRGYRGPRVKIPVARSLAEFTPERTLGRDAQLNYQRIQQVAGLPAITASGGICAPSEIRYDLPILGDDARPVRDSATARFGVDRGGIRTLTPPILTDATGAITVWTETNDVNPTSPTTKACLTVTCPDDTETIVDAIVKCLEFGNYRQRFFPEQVAAYMQLAAVAHAREAENRMLTAIGAGSTTVNAGQLLGTTRDVLATLDRAIAAMENRHRVKSLPLRFVAPDWLHDMIRADLTRQMPVGTLDETLAIADAKIDAWFRMRGVNVTWTMDGESGQVFGLQGDGPLIGWPSTVITYLYPEGSWLFLDGGQLDLGIVRDSTLNSTNDFQMFAETFEAVHFHGVESLRITMDVCPDGSASALVDINPCATGS